MLRMGGQPRAKRLPTANPMTSGDRGSWGAALKADMGQTVTQAGQRGAWAPTRLPWRASTRDRSFRLPLQQAEVVASRPTPCLCTFGACGGSRSVVPSGAECFLSPLFALGR
jgi:hypothetical protein